MWTMFICKKTALRATQVAKPSVFCVKSFQAEYFSTSDYNWPPRTCDLTPLDFFHSGYVKNKAYAEAPQSIQELKEKIRAVIEEIES